MVDIVNLRFDAVEADGTFRRGRDRCDHYVTFEVGPNGTIRPIRGDISVLPHISELITGNNKKKAQLADEDEGE